MAMRYRTYGKSLPPHVQKHSGRNPATRKCLTCDREFPSWGPGNRRCPKCDDDRKHSSSRDEPVKISTRNVRKPE